jgi:hypothetical protein
MSTPQITVAIIFVVGFLICLYLYLQGYEVQQNENVR